MVLEVVVLEAALEAALETGEAPVETEETVAGVEGMAGVATSWHILWEQ